MLRSGKARLVDARKTTLALESRFDLAYNSAHALALAALRWHGYRSENRYTVFQVLPHTLALPLAPFECYPRRTPSATQPNTKGISKPTRDWSS